MPYLPAACKSECDALVAALDAAVASCGIQTDKRPYLPHITLARHAGHLPDITIKPIVWRAESFCLVESCSEPDGVQYKVMQRWPFIQVYRKATGRSPLIPFNVFDLAGEPALCDAGLNHIAQSQLFDRADYFSGRLVDCHRITAVQCCQRTDGMQGLAGV